LLVQEQEQIQQEAQNKLDSAAKVLMDCALVAKKYNDELAEWNKAEKAQSEWEKYHQLIDSELPEQILDKQQLQKQLQDIQAQIKTIRSFLLIVC